MKQKTQRVARYVTPTDGECVDLLTDAEFKLCGDNERAAVVRGRAKAWEAHKAKGPVGRLRALASGAVGDSVLFTEYQRPAQLSATISHVSLYESAHFRCNRERSLVDGSVIGVRVTLVAFTR